MKRVATVITLLALLVVASAALAKGIAPGTYKTTITGKGPNTLNGGLDGTWTLALKNGTYKVTLKGHGVQVTGTYKIKKSTISLTDTGGPAKCTGTGKYKFKLKKKTLTVTKVSDTKSCIGRQDVLAHKLTKVS
jgi:hypothetical protein